MTSKYLPSKTRLDDDDKEKIKQNRIANDSLNFGRAHPKVFKLSDIEKLILFRESNDRNELFAYLLLVTGRRSIEVITGIFKPLTENTISFIGSRKSKGNHNINKKYKIYVLDDSKVVCEAIDRFQKIMLNEIEEKKKNKTLKTEVVRLITISANVRVDRLLGKIVPEQSNKLPTTPRELRKIYSFLILKYKPEDVGVNDFISQNLTHESVTTSLNYETIKII